MEYLYSAIFMEKTPATYWIKNSVPWISLQFFRGNPDVPHLQFSHKVGCSRKKVAL
jgi:hypothetical protein